MKGVAIRRRLPRAGRFSYRATMDASEQPNAMIGRPAPEVTLLDPLGRPVSLRDFTGRGPLVLFFYIRNGTPG